MRPDDGRVVPEFCRKALAEEPLILHGGGHQTRSFCFVLDLVEGIYKIYESGAREVFNLGNPSERSIREFAETVVRLAQSRSKIIEGESRPDDPKRRCPDIGRVRNALGWTPRVDLEEGLRRTLEFFREGR